MNSAQLHLLAALAKTTLECRAVDCVQQRFWESDWKVSQHLDEIEEKLEALKHDLRYELGTLRDEYEALRQEMALK